VYAEDIVLVLCVSLCNSVLIQHIDSKLVTFVLVKKSILIKNGGHLGFGGHFEFYDSQNMYARNIVLILCKFLGDFVLI
jgi:hypothetical protein